MSGIGADDHVEAGVGERMSTFGTVGTVNDRLGDVWVTIIDSLPHTDSQWCHSDLTSLDHHRLDISTF